jgi:hypothetical protein
MRSGLFIAALMLAAPAAAQDKPAGSAKSDDIVVVGNQDRDKQVRDFVTGMTGDTGPRPLAKFELEKLCPQAVGLSPAYDKAITERMRRVAAASKIDLAKEDCKYPNALVVFANDKAAVTAFLREKYPWLFRNARGEPIVPDKQTGPATVWHVDHMVDADGVPLTPDGNGTIVSRSTINGSRLRSAARPVFVFSVVVIERKGVDGLTTTQIADYAAMRSFTDADPAKARGTGAPTILTILDAPMGSETPLSMTTWDLSFMRGLYAMPENLYGNQQRGAIGSYMKRELDKGAAGEPAPEKK